jgi:hypothetical protein
MLKITIPGAELYNEEKNEFVYTKETTLQLEHSLVSISKWESKYKKSFLGSKKKTPAEMLYYIKCMTITQNVPESAYLGLTVETIETIKKYIDDPMTATVIPEPPQKNGGPKESITSELIYYWMVALQIPWECQKWHINRLLTLIKVCNIKNTQPKDMPKAELYSRNKALNAARKAKYKTHG